MVIFYIDLVNLLIKLNILYLSEHCILVSLRVIIFTKNVQYTMGAAVREVSDWRLDSNLRGEVQIPRRVKSFSVQATETS